MSRPPFVFISPSLTIPARVTHAHARLASCPTLHTTKFGTYGKCPNPTVNSKPYLINLPLCKDICLCFTCDVVSPVLPTSKMHILRYRFGIPSLLSLRTPRGIRTPRGALAVGVDTFACHRTVLLCTITS